jgi:hypothetical protein
MNKLITLFAVLLLSTFSVGQVFINTSGGVQPSGASYAGYFGDYLRGGTKVRADTTQRNLIPLWYRDTTTLLVYTISDTSYWILRGGVSNSDWLKISKSFIGYAKDTTAWHIGGDYVPGIQRIGNLSGGLELYSGSKFWYFDSDGFLSTSFSGPDAFFINANDGGSIFANSIKTNYDSTNEAVLRNIRFPTDTIYKDLNTAANPPIGTARINFKNGIPYYNSGTGWTAFGGGGGSTYPSGIEGSIQYKHGSSFSGRSGFIIDTVNNILNAIKINPANIGSSYVPVMASDNSGLVNGQLKDNHYDGSADILQYGLDNSMNHRAINIYAETYAEMDFITNGYLNGYKMGERPGGFAFNNYSNNQNIFLLADDATNDGYAAFSIGEGTKTGLAGPVVIGSSYYGYADPSYPLKVEGDGLFTGYSTATGFKTTTGTSSQVLTADGGITAISGLVFNTSADYTIDGQFTFRTDAIGSDGSNYATQNFVTGTNWYNGNAQVGSADVATNAVSADYATSAGTLNSEWSTSGGNLVPVGGEGGVYGNSFTINGYTGAINFDNGAITSEGSGNITAHSFKVNGGTGAGFLKDNGSIDFNNYLKPVDTTGIRPQLVAGSNMTITGTYPTLTINGTTTTGLSSGTVLFANNNRIDGSPSSFYFDSINFRLGIGTVYGNVTTLVPTLYSNTRPSPYICTTNAGSSGANPDNTYQTWSLTGYSTYATVALNPSPSNPLYTTIYLGSSYIANAYDMITHSVRSQLPYKWKILGSNDSTNWTVLDDKTFDLAINTTYTFTFDNTTYYSYYRYVITEGSGHPYCTFGVIHLKNITNAHVTPLAKNHIYTSSATEKGQIIQGVTSQTANLSEWSDNTGTVLSSVDANGNINTNKNINLSSGSKLNIATGTNASIGTATLSSGTVTVNTTAVTTNSIILLTYQNCSSCGTPYISNRVATSTIGTSFTITSTNGSDASLIAYQIIN